jgi:hypothetical protein
VPGFRPRSPPLPFPRPPFPPLRRRRHRLLRLQEERTAHGAFPFFFFPPCTTSARFLLSACHLCSPVSTITAHLRPRLSQPEGPPSRPLHLTLAQARADGYRLRHEHFFDHRFFPDELDIASRHPCTTDPATASRRTTRPRRPLASTSSPSVTICPSCCHRPHRHWLPHRCQPSMMSPLPPNRRQPVPLSPGFLPGNSLFGEPPLADRISPEKPPTGKGKMSPDFLLL